MIIRPTTPEDRVTILGIHRAAFGSEEEPELVAALIDDPSAAPLVSLLAETEAGAIGHVLVTAGQAPSAGRVHVLAPLAVLPAHHGKGAGGALVREALARCAPEPVATFGDPAYYGRFGFVPGVDLGLLPPHDTALGYPGAWQVAQLTGPIVPAVRVTCAKSLMPAEYWAV